MNRPTILTAALCALAMLIGLPVAGLYTLVAQEREEADRYAQEARDQGKYIAARAAQWRLERPRNLGVFDEPVFETTISLGRNLPEYNTVNLRAEVIDGNLHVTLKRNGVSFRAKWEEVK